MARTPNSMTALAADERVLRKLVSASLAWPRCILGLWAVATGLLAAAASGVAVDTSTDNVLDRSDPAWQFYRRSVEVFGGDEVVVVAFESADPLDQAAAELILEISSQLQAVQGVQRVDSLSTVELVRFREERVELEPLLAPAESPFSMRDIRATLRTDRVARDSLVSRDLRVSALNLLLEDNLGAATEGVVARIREVASAHGAWVSGVPIFRTEINTTAGAEIGTFVAATIALVALILALTFRSMIAVVLPLLVGGVGTVATLAAMAATGTAITLSTVILPSVMLALGCAYAMHLLSAATGQESVAELALSLHPVLRPTALSGLTTTIGFLAISQVGIDAIREVGAFGALGVMSVTLATLSFAPAALAVWPIPARRRPALEWVSAQGAPLLRVLWDQWGGRVLVLASGCTAVLAAGLLDLNVETDVTRWFPRGHEVRESYEAIRAKLSGISSMNVVIQSVDDEPLTSPERVAAIDALSTFLGNQGEVGKSLSIADPLRQMHGGFLRDDLEPLPDSDELIEQYLLFLDSVARNAELISGDRRMANIKLRVDDNGSKDLLGVASLADSWWEANGVAGVEARATGIMYEFARAEDEISYGQLRGLSFALVCIAAILFAIYRSPLLAAVALIPNVVPLVAVFGFLGGLGIALDAGLVISACLILGIAVDNTLHVVSGFVAAHATHGPRESVVETLRRVLVPLVASTAVIGVGFSVLALSNFVFVRNLGLLVVSVMIICLIADVVLLPAALVRVFRKGWRPDAGSSGADSSAR